MIIQKSDKSGIILVDLLTGTIFDPDIIIFFSVEMVNKMDGYCHFYNQ